MFDVICAGMALVDSIVRGFDPQPISASGYRAVSGSLNAGGEAINEAIASAKLGLKTGILCRLGSDAAGKLIESELQSFGVDTGRIIRSGTTPVTTMFVMENGRRKSITNEAHRQTFRPEERPELFTDAGALILGSLFRVPFDNPESVFSVLSAAKEAGQTVFADTKLPNFRRLNLSDLQDSLPLIDYITPNEDEAAWYSGKKDPDEMADVFLKAGVRHVIIKLGAEGCLLKGGSIRLRLPAFPVNAVDTTGAGDQFLAGFVSEVLRGASLPEALRFANACGALCTTAVGAGTALKSREQVLQWMESSTKSAT